MSSRLLRWRPVRANCQKRRFISVRLLAVTEDKVKVVVVAGTATVSEADIFNFVESSTAIPDVTAVAASGKVVIAAPNTNVAQAVTGLTAGTAYAVYATAADTSSDSGRATAQSVTFTTVADSTPPEFATNYPAI